MFFKLLPPMFLKGLLSEGGKSSLISCASKPYLRSLIASPKSHFHRCSSSAYFLREASPPSSPVPAKPYLHHAPHSRSIAYHVQETEIPHHMNIAISNETSRYGKIFNQGGIVDTLAKLFGRDEAMNRIYNVVTSESGFSYAGVMVTKEEADQVRRLPGVGWVMPDGRRGALGYEFYHLKERDNEKALSIIHKRGRFFCGCISGDASYCDRCMYNIKKLITLSEIQRASRLWTFLMPRVYGIPMKARTVDGFVEVLTQLLDCEVESRIRIHTVATRNYFYPGFTAFIPSNLNLNLTMGLPHGVRMIIQGAHPFVRAPKGWGRA